MSRAVVRSSAEMRFAASLQTCPECGARPGELEAYGNGALWELVGSCPKCGRLRTFAFRWDSFPLDTHPPRELGGPEPSQAITPEQFTSELERLDPALRDDPATIPIAEWMTRNSLANRALTCVLEREKFPAARRPADLARLHTNVLDLCERFTADAPRTWLLRGEGKLRLAEEIRALVNQLSSHRAASARDLERWLSVRGPLAKDSAASAIRVWDEQGETHAELTVVHGTIEDVADAIGKLERKSPTLATGELAFAHHRVRVVLVVNGADVATVTLHIASEGEAFAEEWLALSDADRASIERVLDDYGAREPLARDATPLAHYLQRAGAFYEPVYEETQYTDWDGTPVGSGPSGTVSRASIPPDPALPFAALAPLLALGPRARELVARHPSTPEDVLLRLAGDASEKVQTAIVERRDNSDAICDRLVASVHSSVRWRMAAQPKLTPAWIAALARDANDLVRTTIAERPDVPDEILAALAEHGGFAAIKVAKNPRISRELLVKLLTRLADETESGILRFVAEHRLTPPEKLAHIAEGSGRGGVHELVVANPSTPPEALRHLFAKLPVKVAAHPSLPADLGPMCARHTNPSVRGAYAGNPGADPALLSPLVDDPSVYVRLALADNRAFTALADLATDGNVDVRRRLARRSDASVEVLEALRRDDDEQVRAAAKEQLAARAPKDTKPRDEVDRMIALLKSEKPELRVDAAETLAEIGDARALEPLDDVARFDKGTIDIEGAYVDRREAVAAHARRALGRILDRVPQDTPDRYRRYMVWPTGASNVPGPVRSSNEMTFAASLESCPKCKRPVETGFLSYGDQGKGAWLWGKCRGCGAGMNFSFTHEGGNLLEAKHPRLELGGPEPSRVITPEQFLGELDRLSALIGDDAPGPLPLDNWVTRRAKVERAMTCLLELRKFPVAQQPPDLAERHARMSALNERYIADAPRTWLVGTPTLQAGDEIQALRNQATSARQVAPADFQAWLTVREERAKERAATAIRVWEDDAGTWVEVKLVRARLAQIVEVVGKLDAKSPTASTADVTFARHRVHVHVAHVGDEVSMVTMCFTHESRPVRPVPEIVVPAAPTPEAGKVRELFARKLAQAASELEDAEREALASGKEPLDCARLRKLADCGNASDKELRSAYYVRHPEIRTVAEYAAFMNEIAPWEDSN